MLINRAINTVIQSELIGKVLQHEAFIEAILNAVTTSLEARDALSSRYENILKGVGLVTTSQLEELQHMVDLLTQEAEGLREQLDRAALNAGSLRQRAEQAETQLESVQAELDALKAQAVVSNSSVDTVEKVSDQAPQWSPTMTKAELITIATDLGIKVSSKLKKTDLIDRLKKLG